MIFAFLRRHAQGAITVASVTVVTALVAIVALVSSGYTEQKLELDDASVWVTNGSRQVIGRANTSVFELNTVVASDGNDLDVLQRGTTVLTHNHTSNTVQIIDPASSSVLGTIPLPAGDPQVTLVDGFVVIHSPDTGEVWVVRQANLDAFDGGVEPTLSLEPGSVVAVTDSGTLAGYNRQSGRLVTADLRSGAKPESTTVPSFDVGDDDDLQITIVGDRPALLDTTTRQLRLGDSTVDLAPELGDADELKLAAPDDSGKQLLLATASGLYGVDAASGSIETLLEGAAGKPAQPIADDGCSYAAWADGSTWQRCGSSDPVRAQLAGLSGGDELAFRSNGRYVVLNERSGGRVWAVQHENRLIDNWNQLIDVDDEQKVQNEAQDDTPPELEKDQVAPVAVADQFGARPGRASVIPVLLNDYDPNGDVISITDVSDIDPAQGAIDFIDTSQQLQLTLTSGATGVISFEYTISDGRGGTATAPVTVTVRAPGENSPPVQARATSAAVAAGGTFTTNVLGDWFDPDGDPMYLEQAETSDPDRVSFAPGGEIDFQDKGSEAADKEVGLTVSDFTDSGSGSVSVTVSAPGTVPIVPEAFLVQGYTASDVQISPLPNVRGGTGVLRLSNVADYPDTVIVPNYNKGTFTFRSERAGIFYLSYSVTDAAQQTATGTIRVDITVAPDASTKPITVPSVAFLYQQQTDLVDVLAGDIDPAGGVLSISAVSGVPTSSGAVVEIIEHRILRVRLNNLLTAPLQFSYTVTNGLSSSEGLVTVFQIPEPKRLQAPVAVADSISVRVGEVIDIPVVANDEHPNRKPLVLDPTLVQNVPDGGGLLFVSGNKLRYLAPDKPGDFTAVYRLDTTADVQFDTAEVTITVREADPATNTPPVPPTLSARVIAGETVKISVPLGGMDADGDSVRLVGAASNPAKGNVTVGGDVLSYTAGAASQGTDTFSYEVVDSLGARASGTVRVGISPSLDTASTPVAMDDVIVTTPGKKVTVRVLENDSDPNASPLTVTAVESTDPRLVATNSADRVTFPAPTSPGDYAVLYTIQNKGGQQASAWLRVRVAADAPAVRPEADYTVLSLTDILDRDSVTVNVLRNVFYAEGDASDLKVSLVPGYGDNATVRADGRIDVRITQKSQIIPFTVALPDDPSVNAQAFIWVPGLQDALPELRTTAKPLQVLSGDSLSININDYVVAAGGRTVRLTDEATVKASNANQAKLVIDPQTLQYTSADGYWGPASLSFEVTDGQSASDPNGRKAVIVLAITVTPRDNQPPVFTGAQVSLQPGDDRVLELRDLTRYPYPDDLDQLAFAINSQPASGFTATLNGTSLTVAANADAPVGSASELSVRARDAKNDGKVGVVELTVVTSNRPLVSPGADALTIKRGASGTIPVLANDSATNPFPDKPLTVVAVQGTAPAGVTVTPSADKSTLSVSVAASVDLKSTGQVTMQYQVADATKDPGRYTWGTVTITIVDVPDQPVAPVLTGGGFREGKLSVSAVPLPYPNGSAITSFLIKSDDNGGYSKDCGAAATCELDGLIQGRDYQFYAVAVNEYGPSVPSPKSGSMRSDYVPSAPGSVTGKVVPASQGPAGQIEFSWPAIQSPPQGSAVEKIFIEVNGVRQPPQAPNATSFVFSGAPGTSYTAVVWAQNGADKNYGGGVFPWNKTTSNAVTAVGAPTGGSVSANVVNDRGDVGVQWSGFSPNGAAGLRYSVARYAENEFVPGCSSVQGPGDSSGKEVPSSDGDIGRQFVYVVTADNGWACSQAKSAPLRVLKPPAPPTVVLGYADPKNGYYDVDVDSATPNKLPNTSDGEYTIKVADGAEVSKGSVLAGKGPWKFVSCIEQLCSEPGAPSNSLSPVNANASISSCTVGADVTGAVAMVSGATGWSYRYAFNTTGTVFGPWTTDGKVPAPLVPGGSVTMVVQASWTDGAGNKFVNGNDAAALYGTSNGQRCGS
jgi:hypothetical protein